MLVGLYELSENIRNTTAVCFKQLEVFNHSSIETTEPQHVTLTTEPQHVTLTTEPQQVTLTTEPQHVTLTTEPQHVTLTTEPQQVTLTIEPQHVTLTTEPQQVTLTTEPQHVTLTTEPQHVTLTTEPQHVTLTAWIRISLQILIVAGTKNVLAWALIRIEGSYPLSKQHVTLPVMGREETSKPLYPICLTFFSELSLHLRLDFPSDLFRLVFPTEAVYEFLILCLCAR
jgi:hypothetical protein